MSPLYTYQGKLLVSDNKLANSESCCCEDTPAITITSENNSMNNSTLEPQETLEPNNNESQP
jgi:hypothetical protein